MCICLPSMVSSMDVVDRERSVPNSGQVLVGWRRHKRRAGASVLVAEVRQCVCGGRRGTTVASEEEGADAKQAEAGAEWKRVGRGVRVLRGSCPDSRKAPQFASNLR